MSGSPDKDSVEVMNRPGAGFWATVIVVILLAYPVSFGPACWINERAGMGATAISVAYRPIIWGAERDPRAQRAALWYASLGVTSGRSPSIVESEIHWTSGIYADFSALLQLIQTTIRPSTGELVEGPIADPDEVTEDERD
jgi:hypothetical protein